MECTELDSSLSENREALAQKYLYDIGRSDDGSCPHCPGIPGPVRHVLTPRPAWKDLRAFINNAVERGIDNISARD